MLLYIKSFLLFLLLMGGIPFLAAQEAYARAAYHCPALSAPMTVIKANSYYRKDDPTGSIIDEKRRAENEAHVAPIRAYVNMIAKISDKAFLDSFAPADSCAIAHLYGWAKAGALLKNDDPRNGQAHFMRQWSLTTIAATYLKTDIAVNDPRNAVITQWISQLAYMVKDYHQQRGDARRNNHFYWGILGIGLASVITDDAVLWQFATQGFEKAAGDINQEGYLPNELKRGSRAAAYHAFAAQPLAAFVCVVGMRGGDVAQARTSLAPLMHNIARMYQDERDITKRAGIKQMPLGKLPAWYSLYNMQPPSPKTPLFNFRLGGNVLQFADATNCINKVIK